MDKRVWTRTTDKLLASAPVKKRRILRGMLLAIFDEATAGKR